MIWIRCSRRKGSDLRQMVGQKTIPNRQSFVSHRGQLSMAKRTDNEARWRLARDCPVAPWIEVPLRLLATQDCRRINAGGATSREIACEHRHHHHHHSTCRKCANCQSTDSIQDACDRLRNSDGCKAADANTGEHHLHPLAHDQISHFAKIRAESDANADFLPALSDDIAQYAVSSKRAQQQGE